MQNNISHSRQAVFVVFSAALYFFYTFIQMNMFNTLNPSLIAEFHVSAAQLGALSGFYFYAVIPVLLPAGLLLDRFSTRKIILFAMALITMAAFIFAFAQNFWVAAASRFITGIGGTFALLSCVRLATRWFPPQRMALVIGLVVTLAMVGGMMAQTPLSWLISKVGWRAAVMWDGVLGLIIMGIIFVYVKDSPARGNTRSMDDVSKVNFWKSLGAAMGNKQNWLGGIYTSLLNLPIFLLGGLWGGLYLMQAYGFSTLQASYVCSMIFVGTIIGAPAVGWFSDYLRLRRRPMLMCGVLSLVVILILMFSHQLTLFSAMLLFLLLGFFTSGQIISYPLIAESNSHTMTATAQSIASILIMAGGITQPLFGWLVELRWDHTIVNHLPVYSIANLRLAMSIMPIAFVLGLIAAAFLRETHCQSYSND